MADSIAAASNDEEMGEWVLEDWMEWVQKKQQAPNLISLDDNWGISTSIKHPIDTHKNHWTDTIEDVVISFEFR